jgi:hypothetical protein
MEELKHIKNIESGTVNSVNYLDTGCTGTTVCFEPWSNPYLIDTIVLEKSIELVYRQDAQFSYATLGYEPQTDIKIFKIIYSCKKGKWHKSKPIKGSYISAEDETYEF